VFEVGDALGAAHDNEVLKFWVPHADFFKFGNVDLVDPDKRHNLMFMNFIVGRLKVKF
jgi:hypothetical protein